MSSQVLISELGIISSEAKRKNPELRAAADKALQDLKALSNTSEAQFSADLRRRPHVVQPLVLACKTKNAKLALPGITCLQRLIVAGGIAETTLPDVLDALQECSSAGLDIQLKILQAIPSLLQNFSKHISGTLQSNVLQLCSSLQQTKTPAISRTASATIQQAISFIFEKVETEDDTDEGRRSTTEELSFEDSSEKVTPAALDAYRVFEDICLLTEGEKSLFITKAVLAPVFGLELIESILSDHASIFENHKEQQYLLRTRLLPLITRLLSERTPYSVTVRTVRILCILVREHLDIVHGEGEIALSLLNHSLDADVAVPWRRALSMEALRLLFSDSDLILDLFTYYDANDERRNIVQESLSTFVRLASEKPALIGVGQQSSFPAQHSALKASQDQAALEAANVAGISGGDFGVSEVNVPGISTQFSSMRTPCLDMLDKAEAPPIPETYVYSLVLTCTNNISEALAKVVLPLTLHRDRNRPKSKRDSTDDDDSGQDATAEEAFKKHFRAKAVPPNPLDFRDHPSHQAVETVVALIDQCWPAIMATSSTFLYAALDADFYRGLIRSVQKFTQVAGLLRLATPRDAFLTTLSKAAVPANVFKAETPPSSVASPRLGSSSTFQSADNIAGIAELSNRRVSTDSGASALTQRNLMCLRALVNLAIALGPVLDQAWSIILDAVQRASVLLANSGTMATARDYRSGSQGSHPGDGGMQQTSLASEIAAVESAVTRMFQSTSEYPNDAFLALLHAVCGLLGGDDSGSQLPTPTLEAPKKLTRRASSMSTLSTSNTTAPQFDHFAIAKLGEIAKVNLQRLVFVRDEGGWDILVEKFLFITGKSTHDSTSRLMAADVLGSLTAESIAVSSSEDEDTRSAIQERALSILKAMIEPLFNHDLDVVKDIHKTALDALGAILERSGDSIVAGWQTIFDVIASTFEPTERSGSVSRTLAGRLARSAFGSMQLVCSDFLSSVPEALVGVLTDLATRFCAQASDLNLSLTAITLCWNISDHALSSLLAKSSTASDVTLVQSWMSIQERLIPITTDPRNDVRNSVTHTIFRILDSSGEKMPSSIWQSCMQKTLFRILDLNVELHQSTASAGDQTVVLALTATSKVILEGAGRLLGEFLEDLIQLPAFQSLWQGLLERITRLLDIGVPELSMHCFAAVSEILDHSTENVTMSQRSLGLAFDMWANYQPRFASVKKSRDAEKAMIAYVALQQQIKAQLAESITLANINSIVHNLKHCIESSTPAPYSSDVDALTQLQQDVLDSIESLRGSGKSAKFELVKTLAGFCMLPYSKSPTVHTSEELTHIAFAKAAIHSLEKIVLKDASDVSMIENGSLTLALEALAVNIHQKYSWPRQGKEPPLWQTATSSSVSILKAVCQMAAPVPQDESFLSSVVKITDAVASADLDHLPVNTRLLEDETFDLQALTELHALTTPFLLVDSKSKAFTAHIQSLFRVSLVHPPTSSDTVIPSNPSDIPALLSQKRTGRTFDPIFNPRIRMSYLCLDELFALGWKSDEAFPYLVLRCANPLKTYIADQPLRGRMPAPTSQRLEILYLNRKITDGGEKKLDLLGRLARPMVLALEVTSDEELRRAMFKAVKLVLTE